MTTQAGAGHPTVPPGFGYQPALDGVRGVAILLVLLFHGGWTWMPGGYVGVSVFFTLSGFLITTLLLVEHEHSGRVDLGRFVGRRVRRLLPASLVCLAAVSVLSWRGWFVVTDRLRGDIVAAALQVANWRALTGTQSYADLVAAVGGAVGPVDHFWSLSIEEQFYWVWPAACLVTFAAVRSARGRVVALAAATVAAAVGAVWIARAFGGDAAYWSTPARLGELLVGALLAAVLRWRPLPRWVSPAGWMGFAVVVWAAVTWPSGSGPAYEGWLPLFAVASVALVAGAQGGGALTAVLAWRPLVALGVVSYGVYLYHWPLFAIVDEGRTGLDGVALFALRIVVTMAVAWVSYRWLEQPIRTRPLPVRVVAPAALAATALVVAVALVAVPRPQPTFVEDLDTSEVGFTPTTVTAPAVTTPRTSAPAVSEPVASEPAAVTRPVRIVLIGDSTAVALGAGLVDWARRAPDEARVESVAAIGCGVITDAPLLSDEEGRFLEVCRGEMGPRLDAILDAGPPEAAVVLVTVIDGGPRQWSAAEGPLLASDPRYRERRRAAYDALVGRLEAAGVRRVVLLVPAAPNDRWIGYDGGLGGDLDIDGLAALIDDLTATHPIVARVDLAAWLEAQEAVSVWRTDGLHLDPMAATALVEQFLAEQILAAVDAS